MKKLSILLSITLTFLTSCHKDDHTHDIVFPTTDARLNVTTPQLRTAVNRDVIPATVDHIDVTVTSNTTPIEVEAEFEMVDDGSGVDGFVVEDIALGSNDFNAVTTTLATGSLSATQFSIGNTTAQDKLDAMKDKIPYALYTGEALAQDITGVNDFITIPMNTLNGRLNTVVQMEESIQDDYYYEVIIFPSEGEVLYYYPTNSNKGVSIYWSDEDSVDGAQQGITINVFTTDGTFAFDYLTVLTVAASTGQNTILTINSTDVEAESVGLNFSFQEWIETQD
tara:strand:+ start:53 stop:895 length:843 start_codon:yes stop_codon:yes gene_type:complete